MNYLELVLATTEEVQNKLAKFGYPKFQINNIQVMKLAAGVSGTAYQNAMSFKISVDYIKEHQDQILARTVPHEICHLYQAKYYPRAKQFHGKEFRHLMTLLGSDCSTRHNMYLSTNVDHKTRVRARHVYVTNITNEQCFLTKQQHNKMILRPTAFMHKNGESLKYTGKVVVI
jgi:predicted SprT family Zn-dependent metalloprotease